MLHTPQILVADDDRDDQLLFKEMVEAEFGSTYRIEQVYDGVQLLRRLQDPGADLPDLIVLDINMPFKDGVTVLREIKKEARYSNIPVFVLSTSGKPEDVQTCESLGCSAYYQKPYHLNQYVGILNDMIHRSFRSA